MDTVHDDGRPPTGAEAREITRENMRFAAKWGGWATFVIGSLKEISEPLNLPQYYFPFNGTVVCALGVVLIFAARLERKK